MNIKLPSYNSAYYAGLFDGEGCLSLGYWQAKNNPEHSGQFILTAIITMVHRPTLIPLYSVYGGTFIAPKIYKKQNRQSWRWAVRGETAISFIKDVLPWLVCKKAEAEEVLRFWEWKSSIGKWRHMTSEQREEGQIYVNKIKQLKRYCFQSDDGAGTEHEVSLAT